MDGGESKKGASNKVLIGVLCGLLVLIVGLGVGVTMLAFRDKNGDSGDDFSPSDPFAGVDCGKLDEMKETDDISYCIGLLYGVGNNEEVLKIYNEKIDTALKNNEFYSVADLIINRSTLFAMNDRCDEGLALLNDERLEKLPDTEKEYEKSYAEGIIDYCEAEDIE